MDATDCFRDMMNELGGETNHPAEQGDWALGEQFCIVHSHCCSCEYFYQDSRMVYSGNSRISGMQHCVPRDVAKRSPSIPPRFPSIQPRKVSSLSEVKPT